MLTIKAGIKKGEQRSDGTFNIKIAFTLNRKLKRISTSLFATQSDLTRNGGLKKNTELHYKVESLVAHYRNMCASFKIDENDYTLDHIIQLVKYGEEEAQPIDFIAFCKDWISNATIKSKDSYTTSINSFTRFLNNDSLDIKLLTTPLLEKFKSFLIKEREERVKQLVEAGKRVPSNRCVSLYLILLRHMFEEAKKKYNRPDLGKARITTSPFDSITIPKQEATRKRALSEQTILKIWKLPYHNKKKGTRGTCRYDLAKDMLILSFCLIGMNSVDIYNASSIVGNTITYNRAKTKDRRLDEAKMVVNIPDMVLPIIEKYKDKTGKKLFRFYKDYSDRKAFNKAINKGLKEIGEELGIEDLEFYAARHSWATIALNKCHIDKYTVHAALNHVDPSMRVTDIYIERDFVNENEANKKVLEYVFGK